MLVFEFRIPMPFSAEDYHRGLLYSLCKASKNETGGGQGVEIIKNENFENVELLCGKTYKGQYTEKLYHIEKKVPIWMSSILPKGKSEIRGKDTLVRNVKPG